MRPGGDTPAWQLRARLIIWMVVGLIWWQQSAALSEKFETVERERERGRLVAQVAALQDALDRSLEIFPQSPTQDADWWRRAIADGLSARRLVTGPIRTVRTPDQVGPYRIFELTMEVDGSYGELVSFFAWLETARPRLRTVSGTFVPHAGPGVGATLTFRVPVLTVAEGP